MSFMTLVFEKKNFHFKSRADPHIGGPIIWPWGPVSVKKNIGISAILCMDLIDHQV